MEIRIVYVIRFLIFSIVGIYLVLHNHPGWGIFSLFISMGEVTIVTKKATENKYDKQE